MSNRFYIGKHTTKNIHDKYIGSGLYIKRALKKYPKDCFYKKIIKMFDTSEEAFQHEIELCSMFLEDKLCSNMCPGGTGGDFKGKKSRNYGRKRPKSDKIKISRGMKTYHANKQRTV